MKNLIFLLLMVLANINCWSMDKKSDIKLDNQDEKLMSDILGESETLGGLDGVDMDELEKELIEMFKAESNSGNKSKSITQPSTPLSTSRNFKIRPVSGNSLGVFSPRAKYAVLADKENFQPNNASSEADRKDDKENFKSFNKNYEVDRKNNEGKRYLSDENEGWTERYKAGATDSTIITALKLLQGKI